MVTEKGFMALVPRGTQPGDGFCVFTGANVPSILRPDEDEEGYYRLWSGSAYVCLLMEEDMVRKVGRDK